VPLLTVTLNATVDKLYTVPGFTLDRVHRPAGMQVFAGGKGINVARVYTRLGGKVLATGFLGGQNGEYLRQSLLAEGIASDFVTVAEESRVCTAVIDPITGTQTELNEIGPNVTLTECRALLDRLRELLPGYDSVVLAGSAPPGTPPGIYREIVALAQGEYGIPVTMDASGEMLKLGALARPYLLKPNQHELEALGVAGDGWGVSAQALRDQYGVTLGMVTAGRRGAVLASAEGIWEAAPPPIDFKSAVGSGDSLTAAFLWGLAEKMSYPNALALGVAAGAANAATLGSGFITHEEVTALAEQIVVKRLA